MTPCPRCKIGIDDDGEGDCPLCANLSAARVSFLRMHVQKYVQRIFRQGRIAVLERTVDEAAYKRAVAEMVRGTGTVVSKEIPVRRCPNGAYVSAQIWIQDNWLDDDGALTEEGRKFSFTRVQNLA